MAERNSSQLVGLIPFGAKMLGTSESLPWKGFFIEKHAMTPGERPLGVSRWHLISALGKRPAIFEGKTAHGGVLPFTKAPGALTLVPLGTIPAVRLCSSSELISCAVEDAVVQAIAMEERKGQMPELLFKTGIRDRATEHIVNLLSEEMEAGGLAGRMYAESLVQALVSRYLALASSKSVPQAPAAPVMHPRLLRRLRDWMESNLHRDISLAAMAREANYSSTHLLRSFRASTGMTPHQYLLELRVAKAESLLRDKAPRLIDIASECGFASQAHFTQIFKARRGLTPGQYRRQFAS
ncbi:AraC family transcriptional regulator [Tunturiibacter empetritectus]|uniref:AraC family transcriptional regulator n=1 Tax=Tunturiibacter lichenicola TaxID=2051959 RepID=A0A852V9J5_9BACT|nr:AraC family transcriptional regulator [Edaphobacter lichenicola]NYF88001.1 AraC family transcriptional regulator [Edaphobacter lichenicola]